MKPESEVAYFALSVGIDLVQILAHPHISAQFPALVVSSRNSLSVRIGFS
jgi:hypothetical protein